MPVAAILAALQAVAALLPVAEQLVPLVDKALSGQQFNDTDLAALDTATQELNAAVAAQAAQTA
jgi:hypothetical protein